MYPNPLKAYQTVNKSTMPGKETEAAVLNQAAVRLKNSIGNWMNTPAQQRLLDDALRYNQRIWTIFQGELADEANPLPKKLKRDLLQLSAFIDRRTFEIMAFPEPAKVTILIDINNNIAAGLRATAPEPATDHGARASAVA
ncbi:MAG: flagellar biosynthesis regulator FlaF [Pseudomonadota bacterium]